MNCPISPDLISSPAIKALPHTLLISEHLNDRIVILNTKEEIVWEYLVKHPQDVWMLPDGTILTTSKYSVRLITKDKKLLWEYSTHKPNECPCCQPLSNGNFLIGIVGECRLIEYSSTHGIVHEIKLQTTETKPHAQFRMCRKTESGTYLVPFTSEGITREYNHHGKLLRSFPAKKIPVAALRLPNEHTLISEGKVLTEYDLKNNIIWQVTEADLPDLHIGVLAGLQVLSDGIVVVCNWNSQNFNGKKAAHIIALNRKKEVVWMLGGSTVGQVAHAQILKDINHPDGYVHR